MICTVADASVALSTSVTVTAVSTATGVEATLLPSVNAVVPPDAVTIGLSFDRRDAHRLGGEQLKLFCADPSLAWN